MADDRPDTEAAPAEDRQSGPDMTELMLKLAEIRRSAPENDDTSRRLVKHGLALLLFLLAIFILPMLFSGSCNPPH